MKIETKYNNGDVIQIRGYKESFRIVETVIDGAYYLDGTSFENIYQVAKGLDTGECVDIYPDSNDTHKISSYGDTVDDLLDQYNKFREIDIFINSNGAVDREYKELIEYVKEELRKKIANYESH